jgi:hypothetical protein
MSSNKTEKQTSQEALAGVKERTVEFRGGESVRVKPQRESTAAVKEVATTWR